ncbi:MAG: HipA domain-containing protein [Alphaproteobacteria bacterium]|nr:HipA domain-containing protein [Alphaproteobacteria bacterium]
MKKCFKCNHHVENEFLVHGLHKDCFYNWFKLNPNTGPEFSDVVLRAEKQDSLLPIKPIHTSFFQGKFRKYSATLEGRSYILKVQDKDYPELPHVEYLSNQIAQKLDLKIPDFYLICFLNESDTFVVHNFMGDYIPANLIHIYHFIGDNQPFSCASIIKIIEEKVGRMEAVKQFVFLCLFDALIGNHDRHGRNIALIETKKGFELAPFYDNPSYIGIEDYSFLLAQHNPRGKIETSLTKEPTMRDYVFEFCQLGYEGWMKEFRKKIDTLQIEQLMKKSFLSEKRQMAFSSLIERRIKEFDDAFLS